MTKSELIEYCLTYENTYIKYPFDDNWASIIHLKNNKSFAFIFDYKDNLCVNLKNVPEESDFLRIVYKGVTPAYHMNKTHWNTVIIGSDVNNEQLFNMINESYILTKNKKHLTKV